MIVITPEGHVQEEYSRLKKMSHMGCWRIHLRKPAFSVIEVRQWLNDCPRELLNKIVVHHYSELAEEFPVAGINYSYPAKSGMITQAKTRSLSAHGPDEIVTSPGFDYYFLSPVFKSISKPGYGPANFDLKKLPNGIKVFALGGVTPENIKQLPAGFKGVAVLGSVWNSNAPLQAFEKLMSSVTELS